MLLRVIIYIFVFSDKVVNFNLNEKFLTFLFGYLTMREVKVAELFLLLLSIL